VAPPLGPGTRGPRISSPDPLSASRFVGPGHPNTDHPREDQQVHIPAAVEKVERKHPLAKCEECPLYEKGKYVPPDFNGNETARFVMVGEAPGVSEAKKGRPFVGVSGKLLDAVLKEYNLKRSEGVYTNTCLCRPPGNATPTAVAVAACKPALEDTLDKAKPEVVVAMGNTAASALLGRSVKITKDRVGPPKEVEGKPYKVIPTIHPAACLRNTNLFTAFSTDIGKLRPQVYVQYEPPKYKVFHNASTAKSALDQLRGRMLRSDTPIVLDLEVGEEKDSTFGHPNTLLCAGLAYAPGKAVVLGQAAFNVRAFREDFSDFLRNVRIVAQNAKYDLGVLYRMGFGLFDTYADTMLMSYTQNEVPGTHGLKYLGQEHLGTPDWDAEIKQYLKPRGATWSDIPKDVLYKYNAYDVAVTWDLLEMFRGQMDSDDNKLHEYLCWVTKQMIVIESEGIFIDVPKLERLSAIMEVDLALNKQSLVKQAQELNFSDNILDLINKGGGFNPNSPIQVKAALEDMTGATIASTDAETLEMLRTGRRASEQLIRFCDDMLTWRKTGKLYGTYVKGTLNRIEDDGRIRTTYLLHGTETGRLSSRNPNVQNVPRVDPNRAINIRDAYAAAPGNKIIYGDYKNIEGRIVAVLSGDENMQASMQEGRDIHSEVAEAIYGPKFTPQDRFKSKSVVHGVNYARTAEGIAEGLGIPLLEAAKIHNGYHKMYPKVRVWQQEIKRQVLQSDDVLLTPYGRKRRFGLITSDNQEDVYKEGLAFLPQSIGSDITLTAAIRMRERGLAVRLLIHDGIGVECAESETEETKRIMAEEMDKSAREFTEVIPFPVDFAVGNSWGEVDD
jgi:uracil-DNA glycosylase family 4